MEDLSNTAAADGVVSAPRIPGSPKIDDARSKETSCFRSCRSLRLIPFALELVFIQADFLRRNGCLVEPASPELTARRSSSSWRFAFSLRARSRVNSHRLKLERRPPRPTRRPGSPVLPTAWNVGKPSAFKIRDQARAAGDTGTNFSSPSFQATYSSTLPRTVRPPATLQSPPVRNGAAAPQSSS